ncbi:MAG: HAD-IC family P-type ATPase [Candidatus Pacebacteria bacterium]|nr:HAD-IC family P-type ATPase [Candidatus Paceibacterota bacterium]
MLYHSREIPEVLKSLCSCWDGLTNEEVEKRLGEFGYNEIPEKEAHHPFLLFLKQFKSILILILFIAAFIAFIFNKHIDTYVILAVIFLNALMGFLQESKAEKAIQALKKMMVPLARVQRNGELIEIKAKELVPGDIIFLQEGDKVPADARIIELKDFRTEEAVLTGESFPIDKNLHILPEKTELGDRKNMIYMGTFVAGGSAKAVVTGTGFKTVFGQIAKDLENIKRVKTHFEIKTDKLAKQMGLIAFFMACLIFVLGFFVRGLEFKEIFIFTIAALVSGIPEGLPAILVIVLSFGVHRMARRNAIIRRLPAAETLGIVTVIATDKTGTLTQNTMNVQEIVLNNKEKINVSGKGWYPEGNFTQNGKSILPLQNSDLSKILHIAAICNNARLVKEQDHYKIIGDPTEGALVVLAEKAGLKKEVIIEKRLDDIPFNVELKYRASLAMLVDEKDKKEIYVTGAPEAVLAQSESFLINQKEEKLSDQKRKEILKQIDDLTKQAMRVIGFGYKKVDLKVKTISYDNVDNLVFAGFVGILDPPRQEAKEAVEKAKKAGIRVIMVTGDHKSTALAIAQAVGIESKGALTDQELMNLSQKEFGKAIKEVNVFARLTPSTKLKIAETLQKQGEFVAMTGDGINDAPAIKKADIGISMGITGTDVAKEAAEIVLTDDNFASIVNAIEEGRTVFNNTKQTSSFLITTNFAEHVTLLSIMLLAMPLPLLPTHILWLNLVTDGVAGGALASEPSHVRVLEEKPRKASENILSRDIIPFLVLMMVLMATTTLYFFNFLKPLSLEAARTGAFLCMAFTQLFNAFNMRSLKESVFQIGFFTNKYIIIGFLVSVFLQLFVIYNDFFQKVFHFQELNILVVIKIILISSLVLWFGELYKLLKNGKRNRMAS